jgi:amino-acid N-acetyltransferase
MTAETAYPQALEDGAVVDRATIADVDAITDLVNFWAARGDMLPRTKGETYENLRDFFVVREGGEVVACSALHIVWADIAELKSLAVSEARQGRRYGQQLVRACVEESRRLGLDRVFALTYRPEFFERLGFAQADVMALPRKVWNECYRCPKFPGCNEIAMTLDLAAVPAGGEA